MSSFRFLHAADLHLDTPFAGLGRVAPHIRDALQNASLEAWDALVQVAIDQRVAFVVLAGDLYDGRNRGLRAQLRVRDGLQRLSERGIEVFIVHGNHDPLDGWQAIDAAGWPEGVIVCASDAAVTHEVIRDGERIATVHGRSYAQAETKANLARTYPDANGGFNVGVLHATVGDHPEHGRYAPCSLADLERTGYDYWALGHIHGHAVLRRDPHVVYAGSLQGRSPKPAEQGAKGAVLVETVDGRIAGVRHIPLDRFRFATVEVDVTTNGNVAGIVDAVIEAGQNATEANGSRGLVLRAQLKGLDATGDLNRDGTIDQIVASLRERDAEASPIRWWDRFENATSSPIDRSTIVDQQTFAGAVCRHADEVSGAPPGPSLPSGWISDLDADLTGRIRGRGTTYDIDRTAELRAAETLALGLLLSEDPS